ncbi:hypothetical protein ACH4TV_42430 [Streptomyces sp. NPDC020898]|uniref:hypothetical protein n=1 Tax=Streptomyces sp. NPDC020898 TaxID=3365101 RepID=UPI003788B793
MTVVRYVRYEVTCAILAVCAAVVGAVVVFGVDGGLLWERDLALHPLLFASAWLARAGWVARWERRHGLLLWNGRVPTQPLGEGRSLYSSVR